MILGIGEDLYERSFLDFNFLGNFVPTFLSSLCSVYVYIYLTYPWIESIYFYIPLTYAIVKIFHVPCHVEIRFISCPVLTSF